MAVAKYCSAKRDWVEGVAETVSSSQLAEAPSGPLGLVPWEVGQMEEDDRCNGVTEVPSPAASCAYALRMTVGASASAQSTAGSVEGSVANSSKPIWRGRVSSLEERKANEKRSTALVIPRPPLLRGRDDSKTCSDPKYLACSSISSRKQSVNAMSKA